MQIWSYILKFSKIQDCELNTLADPVERTVREYFDRSLTILWPRIIMAENGKKNI